MLGERVREFGERRAEYGRRSKTYEEEFSRSRSVTCESRKAGLSSVRTRQPFECVVRSGLTRCWKTAFGAFSIASAMRS